MAGKYDSVKAPFLYGKVVVTGVTGKNGFATLEKIRHLPGVTKLIGIVRKEDDISRVNAKLRSINERYSSQGLIIPVITTDISLTAHAHVWINWKGVNLAVLQKNNPNIEEEAKKRGMHLRDMLLEQNLKIAKDDAIHALKYAPNCVYLQEGNPIDVVLRSIQKLGFLAGKVISTGTMMEFYRFIKLFSDKFPSLTLNRATGLYIGEHGEQAVPVKSRISFGGVIPEEYALAIEGQSGLDKIDQIYNDVNTEAFWIREKTGETPSEGPSSVTADLVKMILVPQKKTIAGIASYIETNKHYNLEDIGISLPVLIGVDGVERVIEIELSNQEKLVLKEASEHIGKMNVIADKMSM